MGGEHWVTSISVSWRTSGPALLDHDLCLRAAYSRCLIGAHAEAMKCTKISSGSQGAHEPHQHCSPRDAPPKASGRTGFPSCLLVALAALGLGPLPPSEEPEAAVSSASLGFSPSCACSGEPWGTLGPRRSRQPSPRVPYTFHPQSPSSPGK